MCIHFEPNLSARYAPFKSQDLIYFPLARFLCSKPIRWVETQRYHIAAPMGLKYIILSVADYACCAGRPYVENILKFLPY